MFDVKRPTTYSKDVSDEDGKESVKAPVMFGVERHGDELLGTMVYSEDFSDEGAKESEKAQKSKNEPEKLEWKNSVLLRTATFGLNGFFFAAHVVLNGKYLASLGALGPSASSLTSTSQAVIVGSGVGLLLGTGLDFGTALGKKEYRTAGDVAKTATILSLALGGLSAGALLSTRGIFPLLFEKGTAKMASDFFTGYAVAPVPLLFLIVGPQIAFQEGDWYIPPASMFSVLTISGVASYLLGFRANLGALGVGLGGTIGCSLAALVLVAWSFRDNYKKYELYACHIDGFSGKVKSLLNSGWRLSLQRLTEWGNLLVITTIIGVENNNDLIALNPAMSYLVLFGTAQQGFAQAAGMIISKNKGAIQKAIQEGDTTAIARYHKNNIHAIIRSNLFGLSLNSAIAISFSLAKKPLTNFFLSHDTNIEVKKLSESLLWINMVGLIPDAARIISAGAFRAWNDLLYPTVVSSILMTAVGIPAGYGVGKLVHHEIEFMIGVRDVTMLLSALFILKRCYNHIKNDAVTLGISKPLLFSRRELGTDRDLVFPEPGANVELLHDAVPLTKKRCCRCTIL